MKKTWWWLVDLLLAVCLFIVVFSSLHLLDCRTKKTTNASKETKYYQTKDERTNSNTFSFVSKTHNDLAELNSKTRKASANVTRLWQRITNASHTAAAENERNSTILNDLKSKLNEIEKYLFEQKRLRRIEDTTKINV